MNVTTSTTGMSDLYNSTGAAPARKAKQSLDSADFMKLLAVQFQQQDPMKPMEDTAFIAQMAQFSSLEQTQVMTMQLAMLRADQQLLTGTGYLGRTVTVEKPDGSLVTGVAESVENAADGIFLRIGGGSYPLGAVRRVETTPVNLQPQPDPDAPAPAA